MEIVFAPRAKLRLDNIATYLAENNVSNEIIIAYLTQFEAFLIPVSLIK